MFWILLSLTGAFLQAFGSAVSKKVLQLNDKKYLIGFVSYGLSGLIFFALHSVTSGQFWMSGLSEKFWINIVSYSVINIIGALCLYQALELAELNYVMPFMTLTSLSLVIPPIFLLGEIPTVGNIFGIILIVGGAILINHEKRKMTHNEFLQRTLNRRGLKFFMGTALCYTLLPTLSKITIGESSVFFMSALSAILISLGFLLIMIVRGKLHEFETFSWKTNRIFVLGVFLLGLNAVIENGSINTALTMAPVAQVFTIKRLMPFFAFLIGFFYFKERDNLPKKILATSLMVAGAIATILF